MASTSISAGDLTPRLRSSFSAGVSAFNVDCRHRRWRHVEKIAQDIINLALGRAFAFARRHGQASHTAAAFVWKLAGAVGCKGISRSGAASRERRDPSDGKGLMGVAWAYNQIQPGRDFEDR